MTGRRMVDRWEDDNKIFMSLAIKKRLLPSMYGGIIGDMLGVPVEFKKEGLSLLMIYRDMEPIISRQAPGRMILR